MEERTFKITEKELDKIFQFIISKPIKEAIEFYAICLEVGKRDEVKFKETGIVYQTEDKAETKEEKIDE